MIGNLDALDAITDYMSLSDSPKVLQRSPITSNFKLVIFHISLGPVEAEQVRQRQLALGPCCVALQGFCLTERLGAINSFIACLLRLLLLV